MHWCLALLANLVHVEAVPASNCTNKLRAAVQASISSRPLTSHGSKGRQKQAPPSLGPFPTPSSVYSMTSPGAAPWGPGGGARSPITGQLLPGRPGMAGGSRSSAPATVGTSAVMAPLSRMGSFSQPPSLETWAPSAMASTSPGIPAAPWEHCQGSQEAAYHGDSCGAPMAGPVGGCWGPQQDGPAAGDRGGQPYVNSRRGSTESLPPLRHGRGLGHFAASGSPQSSGRPDYRMHIRISPTGKVQRSGAGAGQCLQW